MYLLQIKLFDDLGKDMLANAWQGYNASLFAYGQTGSGKSYSIMGSKENRGKLKNDVTSYSIMGSKENRGKLKSDVTSYSIMGSKENRGKLNSDGKSYSIMCSKENRGKLNSNVN